MGKPKKNEFNICRFCGTKIAKKVEWTGRITSGYGKIKHYCNFRCKYYYYKGLLAEELVN